MRADAVAEQAAGLRLLFEHGDAVTAPGQVRGRGNAGRAGTDNSDPLRPGGFDRSRRCFTGRGLAGCVRPFIVGQEALDGADGHRVVHPAAATGLLAGVGAHPAADAGQDVVPPDQGQGLVVAALGGQGDVALGVHAQGAVFLAERLAALVDPGPAGQAGAARVAQGMAAVRTTHRADRIAFAAEHAAVRVDKGLLPVDAHAEPLGRVLDRTDPRRQQGADLGVAQDADQAGPMGGVEGQARGQAVLFGGQLFVQVRGAVDQGHRDAQFAQLVGGGDAFRRRAGNDHPVQAFFLSCHDANAPVWPAARFSRPLRVERP